MPQENQHTQNQNQQSGSGQRGDPSKAVSRRARKTTRAISRTTAKRLRKPDAKADSPKPRLPKDVIPYRRRESPAKPPPGSLLFCMLP